MLLFIIATENLKTTELKIITKILQIGGEKVSLRPGSLEADQGMRTHVPVFEERRRPSRQGEKAKQ